MYIYIYRERERLGTKMAIVLSGGHRRGPRIKNKFNIISVLL